MTRKKTPASGTVASHKSKARSRVTNGSALLPSIDGRSIWARIFRDVQNALVEHAGGEDRVSTAQRMVIRRAAALECEMIHLEDHIASRREAGEEPDIARLDLYQRLANSQRRLLEVLGWDRVLKDVTPDLNAYLKDAAR